MRTLLKFSFYATVRGAHDSMGEDAAHIVLVAGSDSRALERALHFAHIVKVNASGQLAMPDVDLVGYVDGAEALAESARNHGLPNGSILLVWRAYLCLEGRLLVLAFHLPS